MVEETQSRNIRTAKEYEMNPEYQYIITGFLFGLIVALDVMCICNIISALMKRRRLERQKEKDELIRLARRVEYNDLPPKYKKILKGEHDELDERKK